MSIRIIIRDLPNHLNSTVLIQGFLHKKREVSSKLAFLILRDRSGLVQIVLQEDEQIQKLKGLQNGSIISCIGIVKAEPRANGGVEIHEPKLEIQVPITEVAPIEIDKEINHNSENFDTLFDNRALNIRNFKEQQIFKIRESVKDAFREYLKSQDFTEFESPKLLAGATEGGAEVFTLDYFGKTASLAQSSQFYKQILVGGFERVFEINASYRAEPSFTPRHMTEFTQIDFEMGFLNSFDDLLEMTENLINYVYTKVWEKDKDSLEMHGAVKPLLTEKFPRITLRDLLELYYKETGIDNRGEKDPSPVHERFISDYSAKNWNSEAVYITEFPSSEMKFYHRKNAENPEVCDRADLIFRGVELATVPMRENRYEVLVEQMKSAGLDPESEGNKYYVSAFKHGLPVHGGFGMGLERVVKNLIGLSSVKEATLFPRDLNRLAP